MRSRGEFASDAQDPSSMAPRGALRPDLLATCRPGEGGGAFRWVPFLWSLPPSVVAIPENRRSLQFVW